MKIRKKIVIFTFIVAVLSIFFIFFFLNTILLNKFAQLDEDDIRSDMENIIYTLEDEIQAINTIMMNYSAWDDTSLFVQEAKTYPDPYNVSYIRSNYTEATFTLNHLHMVALYNDQQELVYGRFYNYEREQLTPIPPKILEGLIGANSGLFQFNLPDDSYSGILSNDEEPMMIVSLPIVTSSMEYPMVGTLIVGRMLDQYQINRINKQTNSEIEVHNFANQDTTRAWGKPIWFTKGSTDKLLKVNSIVYDLFGKPALILSTEKERVVYLQGVKSVINYALIMFICVVIVYFIVTLFIKRFITDRIVKLVHNIRTINQKTDFSLRINSSGKDEFSELENEFNFMMNSLENARNTLQTQVLHDSLTTLPNRAFFYEKLESALKQSPVEENNLLAIIYIDLNNFKWVNDTWGHDHGDALLVEVAKRLRHCAQPPNMVFRIGGDEFTVLIANLNNKAAAKQRVEEILDYMSGAPYSFKGRELSISASIGVSIYPLDGDNADKLVKRADIAMFYAKQSGTQVALYSDELQAKNDRQTLIERYINFAVSSNALLLHYQPIVDVTSKRTVALEALVRWRHPDLGWLSPAEFIPIAESTGAIIDIGSWVLHRACTDIRFLQQNGFPELEIYVNLSVYQLEREFIVKEILATLHETGLQLHQLNLEITESATMSHDKAAINLQQLLGHGVRIAVDDFGTGYSSLSYLRRFPVNVIKIDRSFISEMTETNVNSTIAKSIIDLGQ